MPESPIPWVGVMAHKGGVGKSTLAANLAACLAKFDLRILMIETSIRRGL
jgi:cellulose biosynthesis protein BcsQ